jgi:hypothetical protein
MRILALVLATAFATVSWAQPAPLSGVFYLSPATSSLDHYTPAVVRRADRSLVAAWYTFDGSNTTVWARLFDAVGAPLTGMIQVGTSTGTPLGLDVAADAAGNFIVVWPSDSVDVYARRFDAAGVATTGAFRVDDVGSMGADVGPAVAMAGDGRCVIVWESGSNVVGRRYDAAGTADAELVDIAVPNSGPAAPAVAMRDDGTFVVAFSSDDDVEGQDVEVKGFAADGQPAFGPTRVNPDLDGSHDAANRHAKPAIAMQADGAFRIAWHRERADGVSDVYLRGFAPTGAPARGAVQVSTSDASLGAVALATDATGAATVAWIDDLSGRVLARSYRRDGVADGGSYEVRVAGDGFSSLTPRGIAFDDDGTFLLVWSGTSDERRVEARRYGAIAEPRGGGGAVGASGLLALLCAVMARRRRRPRGAGRTSGSPARC